MTSSTPEISKPLAATSVATKTWNLLSRKPCKTTSLLFCAMSPCKALAPFSKLDCRASHSSVQSLFVSQNKIHLPPVGAFARIKSGINDTRSCH